MMAQQQTNLVMQLTRSTLVILGSMLPDPEASDALPWFDDLIRNGFCVLQDARTMAQTLTALLPMVASCFSRSGMEARIEVMLRSLLPLVRSSEAACEVLRGDFANAVFGLCSRIEAPPELLSAAANFLSDLMSYSHVPVAPAPQVNRMPAEEYVRVLHGVTSIALRLGSTGFSGIPHARVHWLWMLDIIVPALGREAILDVAAHAFKALMLRATNCGTAHWLVAAGSLGMFLSSLFVCRVV